MGMWEETSPVLLDIGGPGVTSTTTLTLTVTRQRKQFQPDICLEPECYLIFVSAYALLFKKNPLGVIAVVFRRLRNRFKNLHCCDSTVPEGFRQ
jgi:hypothetical protein